VDRRHFGTTHGANGAIEGGLLVKAILSRWAWARSAITLALLSLTVVVPQAVAQPEGEFRIAFGSSQNTLDPQLHFIMTAYSTGRFTHDPLIASDFDGNLIPWLATSWEAIDDLTWRFSLREGVTFQDGTPFNAESVRATLLRYLTDEVQAVSFQAGLYTFIDDVIVEDEYTVLIKTAAPTRNLLNMLSLAEMLPAWVLEDSERYSAMPIGTGPYKYSEFEPGRLIVMEANHDYWAHVPRFERITARVIPEAFTRVSALLSGEVDLIELVPLEMRATLEAQGIDVLTISSGRVAYLAFHIEKLAMLEDPRLRQAIRMAIDKEAIVDDLFEGTADVAHTLSHPTIPFTKPDLTPADSYDPEGARALLQELGYGDGLTLTIGTDIGRSLKDAEIAQAIASQMARAGITLEVLQTERNVFSENRAMGEDSMFDSWYSSWGGGITGEMDWALRWLNDESNLHGYHNPRVLELLDLAQQSLDDAVAEAYYHELQEIVWTESPYVPILFQPFVYAVRPEYSALFTPRPDEFTILNDRYVID